MTQFSRIGLIGRLNNDRAKYTVRRLIQFLQTCEAIVVVEQQTAMLCEVDTEYPGIDVVDMAELGRSCDLAIVVGGDGSLLSGARDLVEYNVPILGINRGRLGFLTDIVPEDIEQKISEVLTGKYVTEERFMLDMQVERAGQTLCGGDALNDVVLHPGEFIRMLEFELYVDGHFVTSQRSDGMIVSTPTGSTAYALSGGGPIMHPKLDAIGLIPMNPHTLSSRPMVVPGDSVIDILVGEGNSAIPQVTCDGQTHDPVRGGDRVVISKKPQKLLLIHPLNHNFYERCRSKLGWGGHLLEKS
ncbi:NAD(+) kinase [Gilvimarinus sp. SDUM040013]|uniref:NAD kinase n=1 Tax=Gilvimarinus gilvus TaxID=3058038 RepID=A0ABU4S5L0_9GAMM|nr:NAD(+) kinase [Gilvimarinus sp. SDUM040013]MDO3385556.1 NAD(+) kinase [Gilvimarinus sp. SDUM040013]MDX6851193.1 NAD(+) kinase [Gilvimarinus sp. SDUM040013]